MAKNKKRLINGIISILILVASLVVMILDFAIPLNIWVHPILTLLLCLFGGFGLFMIIGGIAQKSAFKFFIGAGLFALALLYVLCCEVKWWIAIIAVIVFLFVMAVLNGIINGNSADDSAMNKDGDDYKTYAERKKEQPADDAEETEIPELKSFKD